MNALAAICADGHSGGFSTGVSVPGDPGDFHMMFGKRCFFGYVNAPGGEVWWFANPPRLDEPESHELSAVESDQWIRTLIELFADDAGPAVEISRRPPTAWPRGAPTTCPTSPTGTTTG